MPTAPTTPYFTPDVAQGVSAGPSQAVFALPNPADNLLYITNLSRTHVTFRLLPTATPPNPALAPSTGMVVPAGQSLIVGTAGMSYIALVNSGGQGAYASVNLCSGN